MTGHSAPARIQVTVPATSANLGPGFDALGLAVGRYDDVSRASAAAGLRRRRGRRSGEVPRDERFQPRAHDARGVRAARYPAQGLRLSCQNRIPHGRGLASSAAAIVAGVDWPALLVLGGRGCSTDAGASRWRVRSKDILTTWPPACSAGLTVAWTELGIGTAILRLVPEGSPPWCSCPRQRRPRPPGGVLPADGAARRMPRSTPLARHCWSLRSTDAPGAPAAATQDRLHQKLPIIGDASAAGDAARRRGARGDLRRGDAILAGQRSPGRACSGCLP